MRKKKAKKDSLSFYEAPRVIINNKFFIIIFMVVSINVFISQTYILSIGENVETDIDRTSSPIYFFILSIILVFMIKKINNTLKNSFSNICAYWLSNDFASRNGNSRLLNILVNKKYILNVISRNGDDMLKNLGVQTLEEAKAKKASKSYNIHINVVGEDVDRLDALKDFVVGETRKNVILTALRVFEAFVDTQKDETKRLYTKNEKGEFVIFDPYSR